MVRSLHIPFFSALRCTMLNTVYSTAGTLATASCKLGPSCIAYVRGCFTHFLFSMPQCVVCTALLPLHCFLLQGYQHQQAARRCVDRLKPHSVHLPVCRITTRESCTMHPCCSLTHHSLHSRLLKRRHKVHGLRWTALN